MGQALWYNRSRCHSGYLCAIMESLISHSCFMLTIQLPTNAPEWQKMTWVPVTHMQGSLNGFPGSYLQLGVALTGTPFWE